MALTDPLQFVFIGIVALLVFGGAAYVLFRVLRTLNKIDKYIDDEKDPKKP
jgi:hypothetical protein